MGIGRARWVALLVGLAAVAVVATVGASEGDADPLYRYAGLVTLVDSLSSVARHLFVLPRFGDLGEACGGVCVCFTFGSRS
jgi:hypothetical protein